MLRSRLEYRQSNDDCIFVIWPDQSFTRLHKFPYVESEVDDLINKIQAWLDVDTVIFEDCTQTIQLNAVDSVSILDRHLYAKLKPRLQDYIVEQKFNHMLYKYKVIK